MATARRVGSTGARWSVLVLAGAQATRTRFAEPPCELSAVGRVVLTTSSA
jgi:hypothetical protein